MSSQLPNALLARGLQRRETREAAGLTIGRFLCYLVERESDTRTQLRQAWAQKNGAEGLNYLLQLFTHTNHMSTLGRRIIHSLFVFALRGKPCTNLCFAQQNAVTSRALSPSRCRSDRPEKRRPTGGRRSR